MTFNIEPIAYVQSARSLPEDDFWGEEQATITLVDPFTADCLLGINQFSHIEVLFIFHQVDTNNICLEARHPRNNQAWPLVGIFAQRGKNRPNRIGSTICTLKSVEANRLLVTELDAIDGTPIIDIKPVLREFLPKAAIKQPEWSIELMRHYWNKR